MKLSPLHLLLVILSSHAIHCQNPPNIVLFIADDVSWDDLGAYGNQQVQTPNIDRLASAGVRFDNFYLTASSCSPSRNSILTGRYPHNTGAAELHTRPPETMQSFPELLRANGYYTAHSGKFHSGPYARRGFDRMINNRKEVGDGGEEAWVQIVKERPQDQPFFFWFAAFDAHRRWGPNTFSGKHEATEITPPFYLANGDSTKLDLARYYDEIFRFDHYIGQVVTELQKQRALDNTLILVMADNGRPFPHSKTRVNDRGMKTPFIAFWPRRIGEPRVCESLVSVIDIAPTILGLATEEMSRQFQGRSFESLLSNPDQPFRNYVFAEHNWHDYEAYERMVRSESLMYILNARPQFPQMGPADAVGSPSHADLLLLKEAGTITQEQTDIFTVPRPAEELYDLQNDAEQWNNVAGDERYQDDLQDLKSILNQWMTVTGDDIPSELTRDWYERLPGYVKTDQHSIRGKMPGAGRQAHKINEGGPF